MFTGNGQGRLRLLGSGFNDESSPEAKPGRAVGANIGGLQIAYSDAGEDHPCLAACGNGRREIVIRLEDQHAVGRERLGERTFLPRNRIARSHELNVSRPDVGDNPQVRGSQPGQRSNLAGMVHAELKHSHLVAPVGAQEG